MSDWSDSIICPHCNREDNDDEILEYGVPDNGCSFWCIICKKEFVVYVKAAYEFCTKER